MGWRGIELAVMARRAESSMEAAWARRMGPRTLDKVSSRALFWGVLPSGAASEPAVGEPAVEEPAFEGPTVEGPTVEAAVLAAPVETGDPGVDKPVVTGPGDWDRLCPWRWWLAVLADAMIFDGAGLRWSGERWSVLRWSGVMAAPAACREALGVGEAPGVAGFTEVLGVPEAPGYGTVFEGVVSVEVGLLDCSGFCDEEDGLRALAGAAFIRVRGGLADDIPL